MSVFPVVASEESGFSVETKWLATALAVFDSDRMREKLTEISKAFERFDMLARLSWMAHMEDW